MRTSTIVWVLVVGVVVVGGLWYFSSMPTPGTVTETPTTTDVTVDTTTPVVSTTTAMGPQEVTVTYTSGGFAPASVTVGLGGTVTFVNDGGPNMWVATGPHPAHTGYDGTSRTEHCPNSGTVFDQCGPGTMYSFKFTKAGTWKYHNHMNSSDFGTVIVQ